ncbi:ilvB [Symbiodinium microadriaticum]|nr:ilvB [Symbiodinium microadriaticum]
MEPPLKRSKSGNSCHSTQVPKLGSLDPALGGKLADFRRSCKDGGLDCDTIHYSVPRPAGDGEVAGKVTWFGDVQWVIDGTPDPEKVQQTIDVSKIRYAFEAGTTAPPGDEAGHGEMVAFNGNAYIRSTRTGSSEFYKTVYGPYMRCEAAGLVGPPNATPDLVATTLLGGMTWTSAINDMFSTIEKRSGAPAAAFGGMVTFEKLIGTAIALPSTEKENIFEAKDKYYPFAPHVEHNVTCVVVGFVADMPAVEKQGITGLEKVLYKGASGSAGGGGADFLNLHAHLVTLRRSCKAKTPQEVLPQDVKEVYHLDASSIVSSFNLEVWLINESMQEHAAMSEDSVCPLLAPPPSTCNCSEWVVNALVDAGVTHVFGGHGGALVPLVNAIVSHPKVQWVCTRNEANASLMAAAYAKLTGNLGVCVATSGPGASNLTTGLLDALQDQCSMIAITGLKPRGGIGYSEFQDLQQSRMFAAGGLPLSLDVSSPDALVPLVRDAVAKALSLRTVVHLGLPVDVQAAKSPVPLKPFCASDVRDDVELSETHSYVIKNVASELRAASGRGSGRVVIAVGHRAVGAGKEILQLAERINAPVLTRLDAKGCVDESHNLVFGVIGVHGKSGLELATKVIETSQLVISIGNHDDTLLLCNRAGLQIRPMITFEPDAMCLRINARYRALYDVVGNVKFTLRRLLAELGPQEKDPIAKNPSFMEGWHRELAYSGMDIVTPMDAANLHMAPPPRHAKLELPADEKKLWSNIHNGKWKLHKRESSRFLCTSPASQDLCHPDTVMKEMSRRMETNDVLCVDVGDVTLWASLSACLTKGQRTLSSERLGTMGYGLCAGIVASLIRAGDGRAVVVIGDGGVQMSINELGTAQHLFANLNKDHGLILVILDNAKLGRVAFGFEGALGCDLGPSPDFAAIGKAYGGNGVKVASAADLTGAMDEAFKSTGIFILHVLIDPLLKADMATFQDKSITMMDSG